MQFSGLFNHGNWKKKKENFSAEYWIFIVSFPVCEQEQQTSCTGKLQQTTGLIQFCIEALKETDSAAFLQVKKKIYVNNNYYSKRVLWNSFSPGRSSPKKEKQNLSLELKFENQFMVLLSGWILRTKHKINFSPHTKQQ